MRKTLRILLFTLVLLVALLVMSNISNAADGYSIDLQYEGNVVAGEEKESNAILDMVDATVYQRVKILVEVEGPATPKLLATDSLGTEFDIAQTGEWGNGFLVGGTNKNVTPVKATFPKAGTYTITLSLVDMDNSNAVITSEEFTIEVGLNLTISVDGQEETRYITATTFEALNIANPEKEGYTFEGWYTDAEFTTPLDETKLLDESITVYAKFEEKTTPVEPEDPTDEPEEPVDEEDTTSEEKDETPKTGVSNYISIALGIAVVALASIVIIKRKNTK